jgi:hypothetical protein
MEIYEWERDVDKEMMKFDIGNPIPRRDIERL